MNEVDVWCLILVEKLIARDRHCFVNKMGHNDSFLVEQSLLVSLKEFGVLVLWLSVLVIETDHLKVLLLNLGSKILVSS